MLINIPRLATWIISMLVMAFILIPNVSVAQAVTVHQVEIYQFKFVPNTLLIYPGDQVIWINKDIVPHTATASNNSWDSGEILTGQSQSLTFKESAVLSYYCRYHPGMKARLKMQSH